MDAGVPDQRAVWLWDDRISPHEMIAFARAHRVGEVFITVPWAGPNSATRALSRALREGGARVACLGSGADWADFPRNAAAWAARALTHGDFDAVHLDVEPWTAVDWPADAERRLGGLADAVEAVRSQTGLAIEVDVPAAHVVEFPRPFARIARAASSVTIMAYRDRSPAILEVSSAARGVAASVGRPYRVGVDTRPSRHSHTTFADDGRRVLERETNAVAHALSSDPWFAGIAVHDLTGWRALGA